VEIELLASAAGTVASLTDYVTPRQTEDTKGHTEQHRSGHRREPPEHLGPKSVHSVRPHPPPRLGIVIIPLFSGERSYWGKKNRAGFTLLGQIDFRLVGSSPVTN
jgi:hypothetical protein